MARALLLACGSLLFGCTRFGFTIGDDRSDARQTTDAVITDSSASLDSSNGSDVGLPSDAAVLDVLPTDGDGQPAGDSSIPSVKVIQVTAGTAHDCALRETGQVLCWGDNGSGQLGTGAAGPLPPSLVTNPTDVSQVSAGGYHTCAVTKAGQVWCWGFNTSGQVGDGTKTSTPTPVSVTENAQAVALSNQATCALRTTGSVICWGQNTNGELGNGTPDDNQLVPTEPVLELTDAVQITAGNQFFCARRAGGKVACWGSNPRGQLGDPLRLGSAATPVEVAVIEDAIDITAGNAHACAVVKDGTVFCWGDNTYGQLGNTGDVIETTPVMVAGSLAPSERVIAGDSHTCILRSNKRVYCWGSNGLGQLGIGSTTTDPILTPVAVGLNDVLQLSTHKNHTCALLAAGPVMCWGDNPPPSGPSNVPLAQSGL